MCTPPCICFWTQVCAQTNMKKKKNPDVCILCPETILYRNLLIPKEVEPSGHYSVIINLKVQQLHRFLLRFFHFIAFIYVCRSMGVAYLCVYVCVDMYVCGDVCVCVFVCVCDCVYIHTYLGRPEEGIRSPGGRIIGGCELADIDAENQTQGLCRSRKCFLTRSYLQPQQVHSFQPAIYFLRNLG